MKKFFSLIKTKFKALTKKRMINSETYKATNIILTLAFPMFICTVVEVIQMKGITKFIEFIFDKPSIFIFNLLIVSVIFFGITFIAKRVHIATAIVGISLTTASIVELFKFNTSGNHLILTDMKMAVNLGSITKFAYIKITPHLLFMVILLFAYLFAVYYFNPILKIKLRNRLMVSGVCASAVFVMFFAPSIAMPVYSFFNVDTRMSGNAFSIKEKFDNNNLIAFLAQTTTEFMTNKVREPENYNKEVVSEYLIDNDNNDDSFKKPNVICIMSEAFADFRRLEGLDIDPQAYAAFDRITNEGYKGTAIVPTFASFTVKTEFELMFGLPVKSLRDPNMPQDLLLDRPQQTIPSYYSSLGYETSYIHTFWSGFYSRDKIYNNFGYDNMIFDDDLTVDVEEFRTYISDKTIFDQIEKQLKETDSPAYIHTTTMQNHQPYEPPIDSNMTELEYYLEGVEDMLLNLEIFLDNLEKSGEPTIVMFIGDHYPCFKGENSAYDQLNITSETANQLYAQPYLLWNNFGDDMSEAPRHEISTFYLPYVIMDIINAPTNDLIETMQDKIYETPIYSTNYDENTPNDEVLDMFTYDIILGEQYLDEVNND